MVGSIDFESLIGGLTGLMNDENHSELDIQRFFENNPTIFELLGYRKWISHPVFDYEGERYIPDFIVEREDGVWEVFELKKADFKIAKNLTRRPDFYAEMNSYISQCEQYCDIFSDSSVRRHLLEEYNINPQRKPNAVLLVGRDDGYDQKMAHDLLANRKLGIRVLTFDGLVSIIQSELNKHLGLNYYSSGLFYQQSIYIGSGLGDVELLRLFSKTEATKFLIGVRQGTLYMRCNSNGGSSIDFSSTPGLLEGLSNRFSSFRFEVLSSGVDVVVYLYVNDLRIFDIRSSDLQFSFDYDVEANYGFQEMSKSDNLKFEHAVVISQSVTVRDKWIISQMLSNLDGAMRVSGESPLAEFLNSKN